MRSLPGSGACACAGSGPHPRRSPGGPRAGRDQADSRGLAPPLAGGLNDGSDGPRPWLPRRRTNGSWEAARRRRPLGPSVSERRFLTPGPWVSGEWRARRPFRGPGRARLPEAQEAGVCPEVGAGWEGLGGRPRGVPGQDARPTQPRLRGARGCARPVQWACARARVAWALSLQAVPPPRRATAAAAARPPPVTRGPGLKPGSTARNRFRQRTGSSLVSLTFNVSGIKSCHKPELLKQWGMFTSVILRDYLSVSHSLTT